MKFRCRIIVAWCALGVAPSSFGAWEDEAVATVDGAGPVTAGDLAYFYGRAAEGGGAVDLKDLLDNVLTGEIMTIEAEAAGYGNDAGVVAALAAWRSKALADYAWGEIAQDVVVPEEEVQAFYEKQEKRRTYSFIKSDDRERAAKAFRALKAGEPWDKVVARYSDFKGYSGPGGAWEVPMEYDGTAAAEGLFALRPGEYTAPIPDAAGLAWYIYRYGKTVHGSGLTFEGAQAGITAYMRDRKVERRFRELTAAWRDEAPVRRNDVLWKEVRAVPVGKLRARHFGRGETLSDAGGVAVPFDDVYAAVEKHLGPLPEMEKYRKKEPAPYVRVWEYYLRDAEDRALLEWRALQEGADETLYFRRAFKARRSALLVDKLYETQFLAGVPEPTDAEVAAYYGAHKDDFIIPERAEIYLAATPAREDADAFYAEVKGGADLVVTGEARNRARERAESEREEPPPALPPERREWRGVVVITREPPRADARPDDPLAAELRPRVFPFAGLNELSDVFRLADGRWAFYEPIFYEPGRRRGLDDAEVAYFCRKAVWQERLASPEAAAAGDAWLAELKARHVIIIDEQTLNRLAPIIVGRGEH